MHARVHDGMCVTTSASSFLSQEEGLDGGYAICTILALAHASHVCVMDWSFDHEQGAFSYATASKHAM